jgi:hypothetical protein
LLRARGWLKGLEEIAAALKEMVQQRRSEFTRRAARVNKKFSFFLNV